MLVYGLVRCYTEEIIQVLLRKPVVVSLERLFYLLSTPSHTFQQAMSEFDKQRKQLTIKTGAARRLLKENGLYRKEIEDNKRKLDKLRADGAESWDIKNATRLIEESEKMVVDTSTRLGRAVGELRDLVVLVKKIPEIVDTEEYSKAEQVLEEAAV